MCRRNLKYHCTDTVSHQSSDIKRFILRCSVPWIAAAQRCELAGPARLPGAAEGRPTASRAGEPPPQAPAPPEPPQSTAPRRKQAGAAQGGRPAAPAAPAAASLRRCPSSGCPPPPARQRPGRGQLPWHRSQVCRLQKRPLFNPTARTSFIEPVQQGPIFLRPCACRVHAGCMRGACRIASG